MPVPNTVNDTVVYAPSNIYATQDVLVDIDDDNRIDIYGNIYFNGVQLTGSSTDMVGAVVLGARHGPIGVGNDQLAITNALDEVAQRGGGVLRIPFFANYALVAQQIVIPDTHILIIGPGYNRYSTSGGVIRQAPGINADFITFTSNVLDTTSLRPFGIRDLGIIGAQGATAGSGIVMKHSGAGIGGSGGRALMVDGCYIDHVWSVRFAEHGIRCFGGTPLWINDCNLTFNGGYGLMLEDAQYVSYSTLHHTVLRNISGDGNKGGVADSGGALIYIKGSTQGSLTDLGEYGMVLQGIKSEYRPNTLRDDFLGYGNFNAVILEDVQNAVHVDGITHISRGSQTRKPGSAIKIIGTTRPKLSWDGASVRVVSNQTVGVDPGVVEDAIGGFTIPASVAHGSLGTSVVRQDIATTSGQFIKGMSGSPTQSIGDVVETISGTVPATSLFETDGPVDEKLWSWIASGGDLTLRTLTDAGVSTVVVFKITRTGTVVNNMELTGSVIPAVDDTQQLGIASKKWTKTTTKDINVTGAIDHDGTTAGFFNATPVVKPTVSGAKGSNAALGSLLTALVNLGLIADTTTA